MKSENEPLKKELQGDISVSGVMDGFDKKAVQKKLRELGMDSIANKLETLSENDIEKIIKSNPQILKKAEEIFNCRR